MTHVQTFIDKLRENHQYYIWFGYMDEGHNPATILKAGWREKRLIIPEDEFPNSGYQLGLNITPYCNFTITKYHKEDSLTLWYRVQLVEEDQL